MMSQPNEVNDSGDSATESKSVPVAESRSEKYWKWFGVLALCLFAAAALVYSIDRHVGQKKVTGLNDQFTGMMSLEDRIKHWEEAFPFDHKNLIIPIIEIHAGGPNKDGIPALSEPKFVEAEKATFLKPDDRIIGVEIEKKVRAYPISILNYHEIVNDKIGETPFAVSFCPLCDSAVVFDRRLKEGEREFGVSGLLYNNNVLMYDRGGEPERLFSQMMTQAISGKNASEPLKTLPLDLTTWKSWRARHPDTEVLSPNTGYGRNYSVSPYQDYLTTPGLMFPMKKTDGRLPEKTPVLGLWHDKSSIAFPLEQFAGKDADLQKSIDGIKFTLHYENDSRSIRVTEADEGIQWAYAFWFAWAAFHPETEIYSP